MPRESIQAKRQRTEQITTRLARAYPDAHCELNFHNSLQLLIATILSAQTTDRQVNLVTRHLFEKYQKAADFADADPDQLQQELKSLGFFRSKAKNIQSCCRALLERHDGQVPLTMAELVQLAGVGRKTANVVLGNAFQINAGIVVDTHVARLSQRLALSRKSAPEKIEMELEQLVPQSNWCIFSHWLIWHGRRRCFARKPDCPKCELLDLCPTGLKATQAGRIPELA